MRNFALQKILASGITLAVVVSSFVLAPQVALAQSSGSTAGTVAGGAAGAAASCGSLLISRLTGTAAGAPAGTAASAATIATGIPVHDLASIATQVAVTNGQGTQDVLKCALDNLAWTVGKVAVQSITRSTVNWINSGFQGSPAFVSDLNANLSVLSDTVANNFFQQLNKTAVIATGFNLTSPFQDQITQQLRANYYKQTGSLLGLNQYDLSKQSSNPQSFLNGNFSQGGFNAFLSANANPANNPFGAYEIASNALWNQIDAAAQQRKAELNWGKGFLPWRGNCTTASSTNALTKTDACVGSPVRTPGSVIESQLENVLGSSVQQLNLADSMNEIVGALMGQLVNQVLGSSGLAGVSQPASGGGSSYINQATNPSQYSSQLSSSAGGISQNISNDLTSLTAYRTNWQKILDAANAAQQVCGSNNAVISSAINQATTAISNATTAIQQENTLSSSVQAAANSSDPTRITTAIAQYQSYLSAPTTPSATDEIYAANQSADTSGTLYSQMVAAKTSCPVQT